MTVLGISVLFLRFKCSFKGRASASLKVISCSLWGLWLHSFCWLASSIPSLIVLLSCLSDLHNCPMFLVTILFWEFKNIPGFLSVMLEYIYSWMPRRPKDLAGSLRPLILRRLSHDGNRCCICVFSYFVHAGVTLAWGGALFRPTLISYLKSVILISLPKEELNLTVAIKVTANSQLKKSGLPPHTAALSPAF